MRGRAPWHSWAGVGLAFCLFAAACASVPAPPVGVLREGEEPTSPAAQPHSVAPRQEKRPQVRLRRRHGPHVVGTDVAMLSAPPEPPEALAPAEAPTPPPTPEPLSCGGKPVPEGWPDYSTWLDKELIAPFFQCASPAEFLALQRRVDMPRLLEEVDDWSAVRLGALGPMEAEAAQVLERKRYSFLINAIRLNGAHAEVLCLFLFDTAFDDEARALLTLLANDKHLQQTVGQLPAVELSLARRGLPLSDFPEREEQLSDVARGLGRAMDDMAATIPLVAGSREDPYAKSFDLPPPYKAAMEQTQHALLTEWWSPGNVVLGGFDSMTFGVPLGFYHLVAGTAQGVDSLAQGQYEQASRELAPAALLVGMYAGAKGVRSLPERRAVVERLQARVGDSGLSQLGQWLQGERQVAVMVATHGEPFALALVEARGDLVKAQALFAQAKPEPRGTAAGTTGLGPRTGSPSPLGSLASLVDDSVGHTSEVLRAKLALAEWEAPGARLPAEVAWLERQRPSLEAPPLGVPEGSSLWREYVDYREGRLSELKAGQQAKGPLRWEDYGLLRGGFARGVAFERQMVALFRADAALPRAQRRWLRDFVEPRMEMHVGVAKAGQPGVRFVDLLVIEQRPPADQPPRVESFSFKSRSLSLLGEKALAAQLIADARDALRYYGETLDIRRPALKYLGPNLQVRRVRLIYQGGELAPLQQKALNEAMTEVETQVRGVEVLIQ